jgi:hypothetical protein
MSVHLGDSVLCFPQTYQHLCAKLNESEIFVATFGRHRAIRVLTFFDASLNGGDTVTAASKNE